MTKLQRALSPDLQFDSKQVLYLEQRAQTIVQSYWQDLLTQASIEQGKASPVFDEILDKDDYIISSIEDGHYLILQQLVSGRHKSLHSFRRTFEVMLRSVGVSEEINNSYTGYKHGGSDQESYGGFYEDFNRKEINKMEHPWLKYKCNWINYVS